jgi:hypothetical protein
VAGWLVGWSTNWFCWLAGYWLAGWLANGFGWLEIGQDRRIARSRVRGTFGSGWLALAFDWLALVFGWLANQWLVGYWLVGWPETRAITFRRLW